LEENQNFPPIPIHCSWHFLDIRLLENNARIAARLALLYSEAVKSAADGIDEGNVKVA
jgi:hypothetical protein